MTTDATIAEVGPGEAVQRAVVVADRLGERADDVDRLEPRLRACRKATGRRPSGQTEKLVLTDFFGGLPRRTLIVARAFSVCLEPGREVLHRQRLAERRPLVDLDALLVDVEVDARRP